MYSQTCLKRPLKGLKNCGFLKQVVLICWFALVYKKYGHTWHRMSLLRPDVIKQHKPNQTKPQHKWIAVRNALSGVCKGCFVTQMVLRAGTTVFPTLVKDEFPSLTEWSVIVTENSQSYLRPTVVICSLLSKPTSSNALKISAAII